MKNLPSNLKNIIENNVQDHPALKRIQSRILSSEQEDFQLYSRMHHRHNRG